jgi:hypothetical protein
MLRTLGALETSREISVAAAIRVTTLSSTARGLDRGHEGNVTTRRDA